MLPLPTALSDIAIKRSPRRKNIAVKMNPDGSFEMLAPQCAAASQLQKAFERLKPWMIKQQKRLAAAAPEERPFEFEFKINSEFFFLGRKYPLQLQPGGSIISFRDENLYSPSTDPKIIKSMLEAFYRRHARRIVTSMLEKYTRQLDIEVKNITINGARKRFGSCSSRGEVNFSWHLAMYPAELIELVVLHELAHRKEMNHSKAFYQVLANFLPDHKERNQQLKKWSQKLAAYPA